MLLEELYDLPQRYFNLSGTISYIMIPPRLERHERNIKWFSYIAILVSLCLTHRLEELYVCLEVPCQKYMYFVILPRVQVHSLDSVDFSSHLSNTR